MHSTVNDTLQGVHYSKLATAFQSLNQDASALVFAAHGYTRAAVRTNGESK